MAKGTVDFFNDTGGYGFIETEDADEDVFFHMEDVGGPAVASCGSSHPADMSFVFRRFHRSTLPLAELQSVLS